VKVKVDTYLGTTLYCPFPIDLSTELPFVAQVEHRRLRPVLEVPGVDPLPEFTMYPLPDQVADKVCAMYERHGPTATHSSRFRDLVDLVLIVSNFELDAAQTVTALATQSCRIACRGGVPRPASGSEDHHRSMGASGMAVAGLGSDCLLRP